VRVKFSQSWWFVIEIKAVNDKSSGVKCVSTQRAVAPAVGIGARAASMAAAALPCPARAQSASPPLARERALNSSVFLRSGERLEHELAELKDMQWQIRENEARYRCSIIIRPTSFCAAMLRLDRASATRRSAGVLDVAPRLC
jgi:hypothetical protein